MIARLLVRRETRRGRGLPAMKIEKTNVHRGERAEEKRAGDREMSDVRALLAFVMEEGVLS